MEVKPGYKQTEIGVIPTDWSIKAIGEIATVGRGRVISHNEIARVQTPLYPVYSSQTSDEGVMGYLDTFEFEGEYITWTTDGANAGTVFARDGRFNCTNVCGTIKLASDNHRFVSEVLGRIAPRHVSRHLGNPKLMNDVVKRINIPLPPTRAEQDAIAKVLSDVDGLLGGLDRLIAKKCDLKQAAMQQLLSGQIRLPGFHGEWAVKRLRDLGKCLRGVSYKGDSDLSTHDTPGTKRLLRSNNIQNAVVVTHGLQFVNAKRVSLHQILKQNDILICMANGSKALVGKAGIFTLSDGHEYTFGAFMGCFRTNSAEANPAFVFRLFLTGRYRDYINNLLAGSSINNLRPSSIESLEFLMPLLPEQTAIASVLTDMDRELEVLGQRREKTRVLKQAMMQELLTGRTRLV